MGILRQQDGSGKEAKQFALDELDEQILEELQHNARSSFREVAKKLKTSTSTLIKRVQRLEREGVIRGYSARVDFEKLGYDFPAFIEVTIRKGAQLEVQKKIANIRGVMSVHDITGQSDSMVFARVKGRAELSRLVKAILAIPEVERSNTRIILKTIKEE